MYNVYKATIKQSRISISQYFYPIIHVHFIMKIPHQTLQDTLT
jgi:hypothetical protein